MAESRVTQIFASRSPRTASRRLPARSPRFEPKLIYAVIVSSSIQAFLLVIRYIMPGTYYTANTLPQKRQKRDSHGACSLFQNSRIPDERFGIMKSFGM